MGNSDTLQLENYPLIRSGKVRDIYDAGENLLLVASDRLSAFDVILPTPIPGKGKLLTGISAYWFDRTGHLCPNHIVTTNVDSLDVSEHERNYLNGRTVVGRKAERIDIECVVRGYLAGSGYKEYASRGTLADEPLPQGLRRADALPEPRFTPAIKNDEGHDENISRNRLRETVGANLADMLEELSLAIYRFASDHAARAGFILADTKFEFGFIDGEISIIDELLTPDSSRYWDVDSVVPGQEPASYDKQIVRDWLESQPWDKTAPGPEIAPEIVDMARERYQSVYNRLIQVNNTEE